MSRASLFCSVPPNTWAEGAKPRPEVETVGPQATQSRAQADTPGPGWGGPLLQAPVLFSTPSAAQAHRPPRLPSGFPGSGQSGSMYESSSSSCS